MGSAKCRPCAACNRTSVPALPGGGRKARQAEDAAPYKRKLRFFDKLRNPRREPGVPAVFYGCLSCRLSFVRDFSVFSFRKRERIYRIVMVKEDRNSKTLLRL